MPDENIDPEFRFTVADFQSCTGRKKDAQSLHSRLKKLRFAIENTQMFKLDFADFKGYVSHPFNQGSKRFKNYAWLGFAYPQYGRLQDQVQLQVGISQGEPLSIELFIPWSAKEARQEAELRIRKDRNTFLNLSKELTDCSIGYVDRWGNERFQTECRSINEADLTQILQKIGKSQFEFFMARNVTKSQTVNMKEKILLEIVHTWFELRPVYDFLVLKVMGDGLKIPATPNLSSEGISGNIERNFSSTEIDSDETEAEATERESRQITYELNWLAQEKANSSHKKIVRILANYLRDHGVKPLKSVIDTLAQKHNSVFIFEVKSIHTRNFVHQTRTAIGQLLDYEYFQIRSKPENKSRNILKGVVYSKKPSQQIIDFLSAYRFSVFWAEDGNLSGSIKSMQVLAKFLSG